MIKKLISLILCFTILFIDTSVFISNAYSASAYCLYDPVLNKVLASSNMHIKKAMASTTKIMTALLACELCNLEKVIKVTDKMIACEGSSIGLQVGDEISYKDLLYGLMLESGNDAALCIAISIASTPENFAKLMNEKAKSLGMKNTNFVTSNGLDDKNHYSTAYDMALLTGNAMQNDVFKSIVSTRTYTAIYNHGETTRTYYNHNRLLASFDGTDGVKTGFTKKAGRCLVSSCTRNAVRLIAVTLNAPDDWNDHKALYKFGYKHYETVSLHIDSYYIDVINSSKREIKCETIKKQIVFYHGLSSFIKKKVHLPKFIYAPINKGEKIGYVEYYFNSFLVAKSDIITLEDAKRKTEKKQKTTFLQLLFKILSIY